ASKGLASAYELGVMHLYIHCVNFLLDGELNLKLGDWAGASIDGSRSHSTYWLKHCLISKDGTDVVSNGTSMRTEIFVLGTAMYFMEKGAEPRHELEDPWDKEEIQRRIAAREFPGTAELVLGAVIRKC
ncbi:hypothetical protein DL98DRAFT_353817, partial [Cadophora sp. DSE1049]